MIDETAMEDELAPHREWYTQALTIEEERWAAELSQLIIRVSRVLPGRGVSEGWLRIIQSENHPVTQQHLSNVERLQEEFMRRSSNIWNKYLKEKPHA
jgi:hypothetical protein